ncbi:MAG TPA: hypothetical protein VN931_07865 [Fibrobacteria bacterium]|nr:hypothetical protein [Fibrobacteria bacterium]
MKTWGLLLVACLWGCAERDNPYDPANLVSRAVDTAAKLPVPGEGIRVVLPDSAGRASAYYGNIQSALADLNPGDTLWVQGGITYPTMGLNLSHGGARLLPVVIRSFGGEARILARSTVPNCLIISQGWAKITGFAFVGATGPAVRTVGDSTITGDVWIDSSRIDSSYTALDLRNLAGTAHLLDLSMTADSLVPPVYFQNVSALDTSQIRW